MATSNTKKHFAVSAYGQDSQGNKLYLAGYGTDNSGKPFQTVEAANDFAKKNAGQGYYEKQGYKNVEWHVLVTKAIAKPRTVPVDFTELSCED